MRVTVIVVWRPKGVPDWHGRKSESGLGLAPALSYDRSVPPYTGVHIASLLPRDWDVRLIHEAVRDVDPDQEVDAVFLSTMDYAAQHARWLARQFRARGVKVIIGGLYPTMNPDYFTDVADAVVVGEAEPVMPQIVADLKRRNLSPFYKAEVPADLSDLPVPRYDLVEADFAAPMTYEATRGCPFRCSFCVLSVMRSPYRKRPIPHVIRDLRSAPVSWNSLKRKHVFLWDNNLGADRQYFRQLAEALIPLKMRWGTQTSLDTLTPEVARLLGKSGCRVLYIGLESLSQQTLQASHKRQNKVAEYKRILGYLHENGILVMSIFLVGLDGDTPEYLKRLPDMVGEIGVDVPVFSLAAPIEGTPLRQMLKREHRLLPGDLNYAMDGSCLVYEPRTIAPDDVEPALYAIMQKTYQSHWIARRVLRRLSSGIGSAALTAGMNLNYRNYELEIANRGIKRVETRGP